MEQLDLAYGSHPLQRLDLYLPKTPAPPAGYLVAISVHGGGWRGGDKRLPGGVTAVHTHHRELLLDEGYAVAAINYRLAPANPYPAACEDACNAALWLVANRATFGLSQRLLVWGESAGAQIGAWAARDLRPRRKLKILGFIGVGGVYELYAFPASSALAPLIRDYTTATPEQRQPLAQRLSEASIAVLQMPALLVHGDRDGSAPVSQALVLSARSADLHTLLVVPGGEHTGPTLLVPAVDAAVRRFARDMSTSRDPRASQRDSG